MKTTEEQLKIKALSYNRKAQHSDDIEEHIGLYDKSMMCKYKKLTIINPILNGYLHKGKCHTNAFNIKEIEVEAPIDLATGKVMCEVLPAKDGGV